MAEPRQPAPATRALLLTILGEFVLPGGTSVFGESLVEALAAVGVRGATARQVLLRTHRAGWLLRERDGRRARWRLSATMAHTLADGARRIYAFGPSEQWDRCWRIVVIRPSTAAASAGRRRLRAHLLWSGLRPLAPGVWITPHEERAAEALAGLGSVATGVETALFRAEAAGDLPALLRRVFVLAPVHSEYQAFLRTFGRLAPADDRAAFAAQVRLVDAWRRFPLRDPGLPAALLPADWVGSRARRLFQARHAQWAVPARRWFEGTAPGAGVAEPAPSGSGPSRRAASL